jgi:hypothetical protein
MPDISGALEASAIPIHRGKATKKTTREAGISFFKCFVQLAIKMFYRVVAKYNKNK